MNVAPTTTPRPVALTVKPENIPAELRDLDRWVVWKYWWDEKKWTKPPYQSLHPAWHASSTNPDTWSSFADAIETYQRGEADGIGFALTSEIHLVGIDLDAIDEADHVLITHIDTYWETSPSGKGLRGFAWGNLPGPGRKENGREMYADGRYLTLTGHHVNGTPGDIREAQPVIDDLYGEWFPPKANAAPQARLEETVPLASSSVELPQNGHSVDDDEIIAQATALVGPKFPALWDGSWGKLKGKWVNGAFDPDLDTYESQSAADLAACEILTAFTRDAQQIDRLIRSSKLMRPKWNRYGEGTINLALGHAAHPETAYTLPSNPNLVNGSWKQAIPVTSSNGIAVHHESRSTDSGRDTAGCLDLVAEVDQLKARIADLERENARLTAENVELLSLQRRTAAAMRNGPMKALTPVAIPLAHTIASVLRASPEHEGPVRVFYPDLAHAAGRSETTISRALVELDAYGLIDRHEETERKWISDDRTREMRPIDVTRVSVDLKGTPEQFLANVAAYVPTKKPHGGYGIRCPHHPHADVIERRTCQHICTECGEILESTSVDSIAFHDETGSNEPNEVTTPTADTPLQTAPPTSVVPLSVSVCKSPPDEGLNYRLFWRPRARSAPRRASAKALTL